MKKHILNIVLLMVLTLSATNITRAQETQSTSADESSKIYLYRPKSPVGMAVVYSVFINEDHIGIAKNGFTKVYEITEPGEIEIWGETEKKMSLKLDVEPGNEYYVKCGVKMGTLTGRPKFTVESSAKGKKTYNKLQK